MRQLLLLCLVAVAIAADAVPTPRQRDSWIAIDESLCQKTLVEGQQFEVVVEYNLSEGPATTLVLSGHGPWVDLPDGKYEKKRHHVDYPGMSAQAEIKPGRGRQVFSFTVPRLHGRDSLLWIARFRDGASTWPWEVRLGGGPLVPADPPLRLAGAAPGNLFTYAEPVRFSVTCGSQAVAGSTVDAAWKVIARDGSAIAEGKTPLTVSKAGAAATLDIPCQRRGVFGLTVTVDGLGSVETSFARIPDVMAITKGEPTRFGLHAVLNAAPDEVMDARMDAARRLGLTFCRQFTSWKNLEPGRGEWRLDALDRSLARAKDHGIGVMILLVNPPSWAMTRRASVGYEPFGFDEAGWSDAISTMGRRFKGRIAAWEWLNEIVPGSEPDPIATYLSMVRLGNAAAKAEDPQVLSVLAGGLWPRSFRLGLLAAGIGKHIDVLPIHYGNGDAVLEAAADLTAVSAGTVQVWDDETARGVSTWRMPQAEALARTEQRAWAMESFPGELTAGAQRILWFGGSGDAAGNWDVSWSDGSPRPVAASLALLASKLHHAQPQGSFAIGDSGRFHLFAVDGRAVLVAPTAKAAQRVRVASPNVIVTDDQGAERQLATTELDAELPPTAMPVFVEGGDLDVLRGYTTPELSTPQVSLLAGRDERLRLRLTNRSAKPLDCEVVVALPDGWPASKPLTVSLKAGEARPVDIVLAAPAGAVPGEHRLTLTCRYADRRMPVVQLPWQLSVIDPKRLGNLLANGGFEDGVAPWGIDKDSRIVPADTFVEGLGRNVLRMSGSDNWQHAGQNPTLVPGRSYLYSLWTRVSGKEAGSNIDQTLQDGSKRSLYLPNVFSAANLPDWQFLTKIYRAPDDLAKVGFVPVAKGTGEARFDNIRLTTYDGSNFAAEAGHAAKPPAIDGNLADWDGGCPIPLLGPGQTTIIDSSWKSGSDNLRGVAKLQWDDKNLYLAAWIDDDVLSAPTTGERAIDSDSLVLALHPANRVPGSDGKAFCYYLSPASPGGGSGTCTLYRPEAMSGGLSKGQLAKDSSVYEIAIRRDGKRTLYEARFPWSELGATGRLGGKLGCSLQLNDNDGAGRTAFISWGDGLAPAWSPTAFGVLTLVE